LKHLIEINKENISLFQIQNAIKSVKKLTAYPVYYVDDSFNYFTFEKYLLSLKNFNSNGFIILNKFNKHYKNALLIAKDYDFLNKIIYEIPFNFVEEYIRKENFEKYNFKNKIQYVNSIRKDIKRIYKNLAYYIPALNLGYHINDFNSCFKVRNNFSIYNSDFEYIRYNYTWPSKNIAGGLFNSDGTISYELRNNFIEKLDFFNQKKSNYNIFIPEEYFYNNFINETKIKIPTEFDNLFININWFINTWQKIIFPLKGELSYSYNTNNIFNKTTLIALTLSWIYEKTEKTLLDYCREGNTLIIAPYIPKYNEDGKISGLIKEAILKSKEINFGYKDYILKLFQIDKGSLILFDFIQNPKLDMNILRTIVNKVLKL